MPGFALRVTKYRFCFDRKTLGHKITKHSVAISRSRCTHPWSSWIMTGVRWTLIFTYRTSFGASRVTDLSSKEHTRPSITANGKLKNGNIILRLKATEAAACISRKGSYRPHHQKEVTVHIIQHKQLPDKSPVFRLLYHFYEFILYMYNFIPKPPHFPLNENRDWARFLIKENTELELPKLATAQYPTGNSPRKLEALNRQDGSYIFDAESCNI